MFSLSIHSSTGPLDVQVSAPSEPNKIAMLTFATKDKSAEVTIFRSGPLALEQILDLGYEIVNAARKLMPAPKDEVLTAANGFVDDPRYPRAEAEHVPFAINDAIEHDEAMEAGIDSDLAERL